MTACRWRRRTAVLVVAVLVMVLAARKPVGVPVALAGGPAPAAPRLLSETGLYGPDGQVDPRNLPYSPQYPLWTDGAAKSRWIRLPEGARIDVSELDAWRFPAGTRLWKEFAFGGRKVETRMIWQPAPDQWVFAAYVWNDAQTDAELAPAAGVPAAWEIAPGKQHAVPGTADCLACHRGSPSVVLGFSALQLSDDRDPRAPHAESLPPGAVTLRTLVAADRLVPRRPDLALVPPRIRSGRPVERAALGYLSANCGSCHNPSGPLARLDLDLLHDVTGKPGAPEPARASAVGARGRWRVPGVPVDSSRVVAPGAPDRSALLQRLASRRPSSQMPPLGTVVPDSEAIALVTEWIEQLETADLFARSHDER